MNKIALSVVKQKLVILITLAYKTVWKSVFSFICNSFCLVVLFAGPFFYAGNRFRNILRCGVCSLVFVGLFARWPGVCVVYFFILIFAVLGWSACSFEVNVSGTLTSNFWNTSYCTVSGSISNPCGGTTTINGSNSGRFLFGLCWHCCLLRK